MLNIGYHSASLTFYFLMSVVSIFSLVIFITSKLIMLNVGEVFYILSQLFPQVADRFIQAVFLISNQSAGINVIFLALALYFSKDFFIALANAFSYLTQKKQQHRSTVYIMVFSLPVVILIITFIYIFKFFVKLLLSYSMILVHHLRSIFGYSFTEKIYRFLSATEDVLSFGFVFEFIVLFLFVFFAYYLMVDFKNITKTQFISVSGVVGLIIVVLKLMFGFIYGYFLAKNPLFMVMGSVFIVIVWVKLMFDVVLLGIRFLYYLENSPTEGETFINRA